MSLAQGLLAVLFVCAGLTPRSSEAAPAADVASNLSVNAVKSRDRLPTPLGLESDVKFWESVFAKYKPDQCIVHDREDLSIIYFVKRVTGSSVVQQNLSAKRYVAAVKGGMSWLAGGGVPRNLVERRIVQVTPEEYRGDPEYYRAAAENVRCQRGVDLVSSLQRSRPHLKLIKKVLKQNNLPPDLAYLPHLESGFQSSVWSRAGARGLWQLMPGTARELGLRVTRTVDHRVDVARSTSAAAHIFHGLFEKTGSWPLAITAYNYGANGISRAIQSWGADYMTIREKHKTRIFGFASRNYYPSFLAVRNVAAAYENGTLAAN